MDFFRVPPFGVDVIKQILPHRYPFLLVDGITEIGDDTVAGYKLLTANEGVFEGHFPGNPVYPGVLQIETIAQVGACWILSLEANRGKTAYLMSVESAKFRRPVGPGVRLDILAKISNLKSRTGRLEGRILVEDKVVSEATLMFAFAATDGENGKE